MESFVSWLISESVESLTAYQPNNNIIAKHKIPQEIVSKIYGLVSSMPETEQIPFSQYLLGFYLSKSNARDEDYQRAIDNYGFYRKNKSLYPYIKGQPFELGTRNNGIQEIKDNNFSNTRKKKLGKQLNDIDMSRVVTEHFGDYTFYTIPAAKNEQEKMNNKQLYCLLGKGTEWCTASPDGTYYEMYVDELDITIIYKNNKPLYQFGLYTNGNVGKLCQFMDVDDNEVMYIPIGLYLILKASKYKNILKIIQSEEMEDLIGVDLNDEEKQKELIKKDPTILQIIKNPSEEVQRIILKNNIWRIGLFDNPIEELQIKAVQTNPNIIQIIKNPTEEVQKIAVRKDGSTIKFIKNPSEEVQKSALENEGLAIRYIPNPSEDMKEIAVKQNGSAIQYIKNPSEEVQKLAVKQNGFAIEYIPNPSEEVQELAIRKYSTAIRSIRDPSERIKKLAVTLDPYAIHHIKDPSQELKNLAFRNNNSLYKYYNEMQ
jgi:protein tyrosine phosphatase (PTP) superfamily phosphohydrolase (DUF442 family)